MFLFKTQKWANTSHLSLSFHQLISDLCPRRISPHWLTVRSITKARTLSSVRQSSFNWNTWTAVQKSFKHLSCTLCWFCISIQLWALQMEASIQPTSIYSVLQAETCSPAQGFDVRVSVRLLQHREIMAGLWLQPERHTGIVLSHHLIEQTFGLHRKALTAWAAFYVLAALVGFLWISA